jgi:hypothetical protein
MKSRIASVLLSAASGLGFAARFNQMITPMKFAPEFAPKSGRRNRRGIGIKGMASSNMTDNGAQLKAHFDRAAIMNPQRRRAADRAFAKRIAASMLQPTPKSARQRRTERRYWDRHSEMPF